MTQLFFLFSLLYTEKFLRYRLSEARIDLKKEHTTALIKALFAKPARRTIIFVQPISEGISIVIGGGAMLFINHDWTNDL